MPCTSTCDGDFTEILIPYTTQKRGVVDHIRLCTSPFIIRNQEIKTLEKLDQAIKQASRDESSDQASISTIKILDHHCSWKYRAHSSDYPLTVVHKAQAKNFSHAYKSIDHASLVPRLSRGRRKRAWYTLFAHALNIPAFRYFRNPLGYSPYISCSARHRTSKPQTTHAISADQAMTLPAFRDVSLVDLTVLAVLCQWNNCWWIVGGLELDQCHSSPVSRPFSINEGTIWSLVQQDFLKWTLNIVLRYRLVRSCRLLS